MPMSTTLRPASHSFLSSCESSAAPATMQFLYELNVDAAPNTTATVRGLTAAYHRHDTARNSFCRYAISPPSFYQLSRPHDAASQ